MVDAMLASLQTGDFAINSHKMGDPGVYTTCGNIPSAEAAANALVITEHATLGNMITDAAGNTLYLFTNDERNASSCSGGCAGAWPPFTVTGGPVAGEGIAEGNLGTIAREDGVMQVTYNGWSLYYFANDVAPGDTNGQDSHGIWFVVSTDGGPIQTSPMVNVSEDAELGTVLTESSGRTLYMFVPDEEDMSNCNGPCTIA